MKRSISYVLVIGVIAWAIPVAAKAQTFEEALALAYSHDPGLQAERAKLRVTDEQVSQAMSNWRPSIDATADAGRSKQNIPDNVFGPTNGVLKPREAGVTITQPVFSGFRTVGNVHSADAQVLAGRAQLVDAEQRLLLDAAKAYFDVLQGQDVLKINRENEVDLQHQLSITRDRFRIGELKRTDVDQAESRLKAAEVSCMQAENDLANKQVTFTRIMGETPGILLPARPSLEQPGNLNDAIRMAEENSPGVIVARYQQEAAKSDIKVAESGLLPEISLVGSATRNRDQSITFPQRQDEFAVMAKLTVPLYRSGTDYSKTRAAIQVADQRSLELDEACRKAKEAAVNAWQTLITARQVTQGDTAALNATDKALYGVKEEAKIGTRTTLDVLNAEQELLNARVNLVKAEHDESVAILQVRESIGTLTAESLHLPVTLYNPKKHYDEVRNQWVGF